MEARPAEPPADLDKVAEDKLRNVLGADQARTVLDEARAELGLAAIETPAQLKRVAEVLRKRGGIVAAVGAMLGVQATLIATRTGAPLPRSR